LSVLLLVFVSQPLPTPPLQSLYGAVQLAIAQVPVLQVPVPCAGLHAVPHPAQFVVVFSGVSQPSTLPPVQSPKPLLQEPV
jgi:hypothetical protein